MFIPPNCPDCGRPVSARLGDNRYFCGKCRRRFADRRAWPSIRLPDRTKRALVARFAAGQRASRPYGGSRASIRTRERVARLCQAVCAIDAGLTRPWQFKEFAPSGRDPGTVKMVGVTVQVVGEHLRARPFDPKELPDVNPSRSTGPYRVDVWFPFHGSRVRGPDVAKGLQKPDRPFDRRLAGFRECLDVSVGSIPVIPCSRLHLYFAEAVVRTSFRMFREFEFERWLRTELHQKAVRELQDVSEGCAIV